MHKLPANILQLFKQEVGGGGRGGGRSSFSWADVFLVDKYYLLERSVKSFNNWACFIVMKAYH